MSTTVVLWPANPLPQSAKKWHSARKADRKSSLSAIYIATYCQAAIRDQNIWMLDASGPCCQNFQTRIIFWMARERGCARIHIEVLQCDRLWSCWLVIFELDLLAISRVRIRNPGRTEVKTCKVLCPVWSSSFTLLMAFSLSALTLFPF